MPDMERPIKVSRVQKFMKQILSTFLSSGQPRDPHYLPCHLHVLGLHASLCQARRGGDGVADYCLRDPSILDRCLLAEQAQCVFGNAG